MKHYSRTELFHSQSTVNQKQAIFSFFFTLKNQELSSFNFFYFYVMHFESARFLFIRKCIKDMNKNEFDNINTNYQLANLRLFYNGQHKIFTDFDVTRQKLAKGDAILNKIFAQNGKEVFWRYVFGPTSMESRVKCFCRKGELMGCKDFGRKRKMAEI